MPLFDDDETEDTENTTPDTSDSTVVEEEPKEKEPNLPEIKLIIEDGTGVEGANVYCDLDYALEYCVAKGYTAWTELSEAEQKVYLIRGTDFVDNFYNWKGYSRKGQFQSLAFPRDRLYDDIGYEIHNIPDKLKKACIEAAFLNASNGSDSLFTTKDSNGSIKKQKVDTLEVEYFNNAATQSTLTDYTSIYDILNKLLKGLYKTKTSNRTCTRGKWVG